MMIFTVNPKYFLLVPLGIMAICIIVLLIISLFYLIYYLWFEKDIRDPNYKDFEDTKIGIVLNNILEITTKILFTISPIGIIFLVIILFL